MTVPEVAARLGVSPSSVYRAITAGELVAVKLGKSVRVSVAVFEAFVNPQAAPSAEVA
ncbi:hypothetical protein Aglo03_62570 [Actinokineospora globicatena]|uniref:Helix-turn-helix domain-containing protein n=2 Tax=Actinokineospora globicatena TaxID=103729 RepID=A0A9W6QSQ6_9PSEU|nr:hypothetical protein Aglo03_62570 [Actinokineospora globicatena]